MGAKFLSGAISVVFAMTAGAARAEMISIGFGSPPVTVAGPSSSGSASFTDPGGTFLSQGTDFSSGADLGSSAHTISVNDGFTTLDIWVTETGITLGPLPQKLKFVSNFTQNTLPAGASVIETTYFDPHDAAFGTTTKLASFTFTSIGTDSPAAAIIDDHLATPYSITEEYQVTIASPTAPTALSTINLTTTTLGSIPFVPEPSTWTMMAIGFAGLGYAAYGRSRKSRAQASIV
jgi:hypothetical protein